MPADGSGRGREDGDCAGTGPRPGTGATGVVQPDHLNRPVVGGLYPQ